MKPKNKAEYAARQKRHQTAHSQRLNKAPQTVRAWKHVLAESATVDSKSLVVDQITLDAQAAGELTRQDKRRQRLIAQALRRTTNAAVIPASVKKAFDEARQKEGST